MLVILMDSFRPEIKTSELKYQRLREGFGLKLVQSSKDIKLTGNGQTTSADQTLWGAQIIYSATRST